MKKGTKDPNREGAALIILDEAQSEGYHLSTMSKDNIEGPVMSYEALIAVSDPQDDETHLSCKGANDKEDSDINLMVPMNTIKSNPETQGKQKESNNLEAASLMMTSKLKTDSTEDKSNNKSKKINARETRPVVNDEPDELIKRKGFSGKMEQNLLMKLDI